MVKQVISSCSALTKLIFPENLYSIGREAFDGCESLKYLYIPESVSSIGKQAFMGCEKLEIVEFASVETVCEMYFAFNPSSYTKRLYIAGEEVSHLVIPPTVSIINRDAFWNSQSLISVEIPDTVTEIGMRAFFYCVNLKEIRIPDSVKKIDWGAFYGCESLMRVVLGRGLQEIDILRESRRYKEKDGSPTIGAHLLCRLKS